MILSCVIKQRGIYLWGEMRDGLRGIPCSPTQLCELQTTVGLCTCTLGWEGWVKGDSLWPNMVVWATDNCWPVHMLSGMGVHSEKWPWPMVECGHLHIWIANSVVYCTPPHTALENATLGHFDWMTSRLPGLSSHILRNLIPTLHCMRFKAWVQYLWKLGPVIWGSFRSPRNQR